MQKILNITTSYNIFNEGPTITMETNIGPKYILQTNKHECLHSKGYTAYPFVKSNLNSLRTLSGRASVATDRASVTTDKAVVSCR
jgi:hypothetical protein